MFYRLCYVLYYEGGAGLRLYIFFFLHVLCLCATLGVMTDLLSVLTYIFQPGVNPLVLVPFLRFLTTL